MPSLCGIFMAVKCQVLFFPILFAQTESILKELNEMQRHLNQCTWEMDLACKDKWEFMLRRSSLANSIRSKWRVYKTSQRGIRVS